MAQNVATACKMKSRPETTSLGQIATVTAKLPSLGQSPRLVCFEDFFWSFLFLTLSLARISITCNQHHIFVDGALDSLAECCLPWNICQWKISWLLSTNYLSMYRNRLGVATVLAFGRSKKLSWSPVVNVWCKNIVASKYSCTVVLRVISSQKGVWCSNCL